MLFRPISMTKSELARLYFPQSRTHTAVTHLMSWIAQCEELTLRLEATGYRRKQRILSATQVRLIAEYLGEP